jgi:hypothetical protein
MLRLLGTTVGRLRKNEEARVHLTRLPMRPLELLAYDTGRAWRWVRSTRRRTLAVCGLMAVVLLAVWWGRQAEVELTPTAPEVAMQSGVETPAPVLTDDAGRGAEPFAYPLPGKPFSDQAKAPCRTHLDEVEINGGCWVTLERRPPCRETQAEYGGKCYLPVSARTRERREPRSIQP